MTEQHRWQIHPVHFLLIFFHLCARESHIFLNSTDKVRHISVWRKFSDGLCGDVVNVTALRLWTEFNWNACNRKETYRKLSQAGPLTMINKYFIQDEFKSWFIKSSITSITLRSLHLLRHLGLQEPAGNCGEQPHHLAGSLQRPPQCCWRG